MGCGPQSLLQELKRLTKQNVFERKVILLMNLGFVTPTEARKISYEETVRFEQIHEQTYRDLGFEIVYIGARFRFGSRERTETCTLTRRAGAIGFYSASCWITRDSESGTLAQRDFGISRGPQGVRATRLFQGATLSSYSMGSPKPSVWMPSWRRASRAINRRCALNVMI
jgi:hypothetical protein